jgi:hypothetical protein
LYQSIFNCKENIDYILQTATTTTTEMPLATDSGSPNSTNKTILPNVGIYGSNGFLVFRIGGSV